MTVKPYNPVEAPPTGGPLRWPAYQPNGSPAPHGRVLAGIAKTLAGQRVADAPLPEPPVPVEIHLKKVVKSQDGSYRLVDRPSVVAIPTRLSARPSKFPADPISGPDAFASFIAGQEAYETLPDKAVWDALLAAVEATGATGRDLRICCDACATAICVRRGCIVPENKIAWE